MAWIESHQSLRNHPKTLKAARLLGASRIALLGALHCLWWWALDHAQDGDLSGYDPAEIRAAAEWDDAGDIVDALLNCGKAGGPGFLEQLPDGRLVLHDWHDYAGKLIAKREQAAERMRNLRERNARPAAPPDNASSTLRARDANVAPASPHVQPLTLTVPLIEQEQEQAASPAPVAPVPRPDLSRQVDDAFLNARGGAVNATDIEQLADLEGLYGTENLLRAIAHCSKYRKQPFLSIGYISTVLAGWQADDAPAPTHRSNANGKFHPAGRPAARAAADDYDNEAALARLIAGGNGHD